MHKKCVRIRMQKVTKIIIIFCNMTAHTSISLMSRTQMYLHWKFSWYFLVRQCRLHRFHDFMRLSKRANGHFIRNYLLNVDKPKETFIQMLNLYVCMSLTDSVTNDQEKGRNISDKENNNVVEKEAISSVKRAAGFVIIWLSNYYFELMAHTTT